MSNNPNRSARMNWLRRGTELDALLRKQMKARRRAELDARTWGAFRRRLGWPMAIVGAIVFFASYAGASGGFNVLPFDAHHIVGQFGGGVVGLIGLIWATTGGSSR